MTCNEACIPSSIFLVVSAVFVAWYLSFHRSWTVRKAISYRAVGIQIGWLVFLLSALFCIQPMAVGSFYISVPLGVISGLIEGAFLDIYRTEIDIDKPRHQFHRVIRRKLLYKIMMLLRLWLVVVLSIMVVGYTRSFGFFEFFFIFYGYIMFCTAQELVGLVMLSNIRKKLIPK